MLYPTTNQPLMLLALAICGLVSGLIFDIFILLCNLLKSEKYISHFFDFVGVIFSFSLLFIVNLFLNFGEFRAYILPMFFVGFILQKLISKFLWTKVIKKCYNGVRKTNEVNIDKGEKN